MSDKNSLDTNELQRKKAKYEKINLCACLVGFLMAVAGMVLNIVKEFIEVDKYVALGFAIAILVITLPALTIMIISWVKIQKIKLLTENDTETTEE